MAFQPTEKGAPPTNRGGTLWLCVCVWTCPSKSRRNSRKPQVVVYTVFFCACLLLTMQVESLEILFAFFFLPSHLFSISFLFCLTLLLFFGGVHPHALRIHFYGRISSWIFSLSRSFFLFFLIYGFTILENILGPKKKKNTEDYKRKTAVLWPLTDGPTLTSTGSLRFFFPTFYLKRPGDKLNRTKNSPPPSKKKNLIRFFPDDSSIVGILGPPVDFIKIYHLTLSCWLFIYF